MDIIIYDSNFDTLKQAEAACVNIFPHSTISVFNLAASAKEEVLNKSYDIALLNINDEAGRGRSLAEFVKERNPRCNIILISSTSEHLVRAMKLYPSGYLVTPIDKAAVEKELQNLRYPIEACRVG